MGLADQPEAGAGEQSVGRSAPAHTDLGAWLLYGLAPLYALLPTLQWLLALQALSLAFTVVPLWILARDAGLPQRLRWTVCRLWWLQPVVFNTNLFDVHAARPEKPRRVGAQELWLPE